MKYLEVIDRNDGSRERLLLNSGQARASIQAAADFLSIKYAEALAALNAGQELRTFGYIRRIVEETL